MPSKALYQWICGACGKEEHVEHSAMPVGWAVVQADWSMGSGDDYDDCRRHGFRDPSHVELCRDCAGKIADVLNPKGEE